MLAAQGADQIVDAEPVAAQAPGVGPDAHLTLAAADQRGRTHARDALDALLHHVLREAREVAHGQLARDHHREDRRGVRVHLFDDRGLGVERQIAACTRHLVAHVLRALIRVLL